MEIWIILLLSYIVVTWTVHLVLGHFNPPKWLTFIMALIGNPFILIVAAIQTLLEYKKRRNK